jgi:threonyl-tRNA synthetase
MDTHQEIGTRLDLFFIDETSPGSIFWKPRGSLLFNNLIKLIRDLYDTYQYTEVITPNIFEKKLWVTSGHWDKYKENMFLLEDIHHDKTSAKDSALDIQVTDTSTIHLDKKELSEIQQYSLKPMNCPSHCLIFKHMKPLSKDLPIRMAEFGVLHRNEASGALHGLTRVRRFQQDDAHIFCRMDQIQTEVINTLKMIEKVYGLFGLTFDAKLSTRPEKYIGKVEIWDQAEKILEDVLKGFSDKKVKKNIGDGAFYGPKIDITLTDKYKRQVQCGTIQLDFNLPSADRFDLKYMCESDQSFEHPVIIHRAVLGSVERFIGIILEHTQGKLPLQVTPYPIIIVTVHKSYNEMAEKLKSHIYNKIRERNIKLMIDVDLSSDDIRYKIKSAEKKSYYYIVTIGEKEVNAITESIDLAIIAIRIDKKIIQYTVNGLIDELEAGLKFN